MFDAWLAELQRVEVTVCDRRGLCDLAGDVGRLRAALDGLDARIGSALAQLDDRGPGPSALFRGAGRCSQREADRRSRRAEGLEALPSVAAALSSGAITGEHADTLIRTAEATSPAEVESSELLTRATQRPADIHRRDAREWARGRRRETDLDAELQRQRAARRGLVFPGDGGMLVIHGELDPLSGAEAQACIDAETDRLFRLDGGRGVADETRTPEQRRVDALMNLLTGRAGRDAAGPESSAPPRRRGPVRHQLLVIAHADGTAEIPGVGPIPASELARLACTSDLFGIVFSGDGQPLWHGTRVQLADDNQWRALIARDGGCVVCNARPALCEAHHVVFRGEPARGPTDIDNLALVCRHHHHMVHDRGYVLAQQHTGTWSFDPPGKGRPRTCADDDPA